jgi:Mrp family chromosome partitioning ATPase
MQVEVNGKTTSLQDSGLIAHQFLDAETKKLSIVLNISKDYMKIKNTLKQSLLSAGFADVDISMAQKQSAEKEKNIRKGNLSQIKKIIAVSSCKGGVGKSTVAINIAANFKNQGFKVGVFDSDIYGPSLPTLINREGETLEPS